MVPLLPDHNLCNYTRILAFFNNEWLNLKNVHLLHQTTTWLKVLLFGFLLLWNSIFWLLLLTLGYSFEVQCFNSCKLLNVLFSATKSWKARVVSIKISSGRWKQGQVLVTTFQDSILKSIKWFRKDLSLYGIQFQTLPDIHKLRVEVQCSRGISAILYDKNSWLDLYSVSCENINITNL